jgi:hypothetical protein
MTNWEFARDGEIPGMDGLMWSDLPLSEEEIYDLQMSGVYDSEEDCE